MFTLTIDRGVIELRNAGTVWTRTAAPTEGDYGSWVCGGEPVDTLTGRNLDNILYSIIKGVVL